MFKNEIYETLDGSVLGDVLDDLIRTAKTTGLSLDCMVVAMQNMTAEEAAEKCESIRLASLSVQNYASPKSQKDLLATRQSFLNIKSPG